MREGPSEALAATARAGQVEPSIRPAAWIQHHKAGDNLEWEDPGGKRTALYTQADLEAAAAAERARGKARAVQIVEWHHNDYNGQHIDPLVAELRNGL